VLVDAAGVIAATATVESPSGQYAFSCVVPRAATRCALRRSIAMGRQGSVERVFSARLAAQPSCVGDLMLRPCPSTPAAPLSPIVDRATGDALVAYVEFQATGPLDRLRACDHRARSLGAPIADRDCGGLDPRRRLGRRPGDDSDRRTSAGLIPRPRANRRRRRAAGGISRPFTIRP
jgi:hypothetical protein